MTLLLHSTIITTNNTTNCTYHRTTVVSFNYESITLNSNNYLTFTAKKRMNQFSKMFNLGFSVFQKDYKWFVEFKGQIIPFYDGIKLDR